MLLTLLVFLIILTILVLIHEAGHYFMAKKFGIKVEEFGFGLPPRIFGIKRGETIYSINWLPVGGFVKLFGEDEAGGGKVYTGGKSADIVMVNEKVDKKDKDRAFFARPAWQRALVVVAGVIMNTLLAFVIYYIFLGISNFTTTEPLIGNYHFFGVQQTNYNLDHPDLVVSSVEDKSPAANATMHAPLKLLSLNHQPMTTRDNFINYINKHKGQPVTLTWEELETHKQVTATIIPRVHPPKDSGALGIAFFPITVLTYATPEQKIFSGITLPINLTLYNFDVIGQLVHISVQKHTFAPVSEGVGGPVAIYGLVGDILQLPTREAVLQLLNLAGLLSISLAIFNILPIPALDGGRFFFILIELIFHKKINPRYEGYAHAVGMAVLLALILLITLKDIGQLFIK